MRIKSLKFVVWSIASLFLLGCGGVAEKSKEVRKPNILWIVAEDLNPYFGCYGDSVNQGHTPIIDKLASQGVMFSRAYATAPVCSASRSALITGIMQTTTGTHQHRSSRTADGEVVPENVRIQLPEGVKTLPEKMKEAGYFTFSNNKDDYNFHYNRHALYDIGTEDDYIVGMNGWQGNKPRHILSWTEDVWSARPDSNQPWFGQIQIMGGKKDYIYVPKDEKLADEAIPVPPYFPDIESQRKAWTLHYNAARGSDVQVEKILKQLEADGELENTIVFFFSDHGSPSSLRHKQFCYEGGMQVPLIIAGRHPAVKRAPGAVVDDLVSLLDVTATTMAMAGIDLPEYLDGQDLFGDNYKPVEYVFGARDRCDFTIDKIRTVRSGQYRYIRNYFPDRPMLQPGYRDLQPIVKDFWQARKDGVLTAYQENHWFGVRPAEELYDIAVDPHQMNNLALDPGFNTELKQHRAALDNWVKATRDKGQVPEAARQLRQTYELWKGRPQFKNAKVNPEYNQFMN